MTTKRKSTRTDKPNGRPSIYTEKLAALICERVANGEPLSHVCREESMPSLSTVYLWQTSRPEFLEMYARCKEDQADTLADQIITIADEPPVPDGETGKIDSAWVAWQRNRIDARKWTASKLRPKKYGDKLDVDANITGTVVIQASALDEKI